MRIIRGLAKGHVDARAARQAATVLFARLKSNHPQHYKTCEEMVRAFAHFEEEFSRPRAVSHMPDDELVSRAWGAAQRGGAGPARAGTSVPAKARGVLLPPAKAALKEIRTNPKVTMDLFRSEQFDNSYVQTLAPSTHSLALTVSSCCDSNAGTNVNECWHRFLNRQLDVCGAIKRMEHLQMWLSICQWKWNRTM